MFFGGNPQFYGVRGMASNIGRSQGNYTVESWRYAVGLYVAHYATLYLRTYAQSSPTADQAAATGALVGVVKSATLGDSSVSYDTTAATKGTEDWGDLNSTTYGQMLANRAKLVGLGGSYVI